MPDSGRVVYTDDAQTAGISHWPGAEFLDLVRRVSRNVEVDTRFDLFGARRLIVLKAQMVDVSGMSSFILEFDPSSKLLVRLKSWNNLEWSGSPVFEADEITYLDSAPDSLFAVDLPRNVVYRQRNVSIPTEMLGLLSAPASGRAFPGLTVEEAVRAIVKDVITAEIQKELSEFRHLAPLASLMDDEQLMAILGGVNGDETIVELLEVGEARVRGRSPLGPLYVVPFVARQKNGTYITQKLIVQIRPGLAGGFSCVVYGPHGQPYELRAEEGMSASLCCEVLKVIRALMAVSASRTG